MSGGGWDGKWWADQLEGKAREKYQELVAHLTTGHEVPGLAERIAKEIFQLGHEEGYELGVNLASYD